MERPRVLFCAMPSIALMRRYPYIEPPFGSSLVAAGLRRAGFPPTLSFLEAWRRIPSGLPAMPADLAALIDRLIERAAPLPPFMVISLNRVTINRRSIGAAMFFDDPDRYRIRIHGPYPDEVGMRGYAFSEVGGLGWEERLARSRERADRCYEVLGSTHNRFAANDYLVFSLYRAFGDKAAVGREFSRYLRKIKHRVRLHDAARWLTPGDGCDFDVSSYRARWSSPWQTITGVPRKSGGHNKEGRPS